MPRSKVNLFEQVSGYLKGTKAAIEALAGIAEGSIAYATDTKEFGSYDGAAWTWGQGAPSPFAFTNIDSPTFSADQDDYDPGSADIIRADLDADWNLTGIAGGTDGRLLYLENITSGFRLTLKDEDAGSSAANQLAIVHDIEIFPDRAVLLQYSGDDSRWHLFSSGDAESLRGAPISAGLLSSLQDGDTLIWNDGDRVFERIQLPTEAALLPYFPSDTSDWAGGTDPGDTDQALDQLAVRTTDLEASSWVLISTQSLGSDGTFDFTSIPQTYKHLKIEFLARSDRAANTSDGAKIRFNNDNGNNYVGLVQFMNAAGAPAKVEQNTAGAPTQFSFVTAASSPANWFNNSEITIFDYTNTNLFKSWQARGMQTPNTGVSFFIYDAQGVWLSASAITRVQLFPTTGTNFKTHSSARLYGIK
jgi:hypothetical protein